MTYLSTQKSLEISINQRFTDSTTNRWRTGNKQSNLRAAPNSSSSTSQGSSGSSCSDEKSSSTFFVRNSPTPRQAILSAIVFLRAATDLTAINDAKVILDLLPTNEAEIKDHENSVGDQLIALSKVLSSGTQSQMRFNWVISSACKIISDILSGTNENCIDTNPVKESVDKVLKLG